MMPAWRVSLDGASIVKWEDVGATNKKQHAFGRFFRSVHEGKPHRALQNNLKGDTSTQHSIFASGFVIDVKWPVRQIGLTVTSRDRSGFRKKRVKSSVRSEKKNTPNQQRLKDFNFKPTKTKGSDFR